MINTRFIYTIIFGIFFSGNLYGQSHSSSDRYIEAHRKYLDAACPLEQDSILHFVYFARNREIIHDHPFLKIERFTGAQIMYPWRELEPERGKYDFSAIREDFEYLRSHGKKLFIQLQDATFRADYKGVPDYLLTCEFDGGAVTQVNDNGSIAGWVAKRWNPQVQARFALLLRELGKEFDGRIEGINLQESAIGVNSKIDSAFTPERYAESLKINMLALKQAFSTSTTMQYANFMPGEWLPGDDRGYLRSIYQYGEEIGVGLGGPDLLIKRKGQLNHTIAMMHEGTYTVPLGIAVQDGNYIEQTGNSVAVSNRTNIVPVLHAFAKDFMKVRYMFWSCEEPYFTGDVIPCFVPQSK